MKRKDILSIRNRNIDLLEIFYTLSIISLSVTVTLIANFIHPINFNVITEGIIITAIFFYFYIKEDIKEEIKEE